jgi:hypothetical protein
MDFFLDRVSQAIYLGWLQTVILLISASWVAGIIDVSHWWPCYKKSLNTEMRRIILAFWNNSPWSQWVITRKSSAQRWTDSCWADVLVEALSVQGHSGPCGSFWSQQIGTVSNHTQEPFLHNLPILFVFGWGWHKWLHFDSENSLISFTEAIRTQYDSIYFVHSHF